MRISYAGLALAIPVAVFLTACSPGNDEPESVPSAGLSVDGTDLASTTPDSGLLEDSAAYADGDTMSREEWALMSWFGDGDPPPLPTLIREVGYEEELEVLASCLTDRGFPVVWDEDGNGMRSEAGSAEQSEAFSVAYYECRAQYPLEPKYYQPYNDAQLTAWYRHLVGDATECLASQGYVVTERPPSQETWISHYRSGEYGLWHPFFDAVPEAELNDIDDTCPMQPDNFFDLATPVD